LDRGVFASGLRCASDDCRRERIDNACHISLVVDQRLGEALVSHHRIGVSRRDDAFAGLGRRCGDRLVRLLINIVQAGSQAVAQLAYMFGGLLQVAQDVRMVVVVDGQVLVCSHHGLRHPACGEFGELPGRGAVVIGVLVGHRAGSGERVRRSGGGVLALWPEPAGHDAVRIRPVRR